MNQENLIDINIEQFIHGVKEKVKEGESYRDAILMLSVIEGGDVAKIVSKVDLKYQEASYNKTELSQQENVDECALASMGKLWEGENFEGNTDQISCSKDEIFTDTLYLIMKYENSENPLQHTLDANEKVCGDKIARKRLIELAYEI
jgi:hypothetical protein